MNVMTYIHMRHIDFRHSIVCDRGQFFSLTKPRGPSKSAGWRLNKCSWWSFVCRKTSIHPTLFRPPKQSVFVGPACTLNYAYLPHAQWDHWMHTEVWGGQGSYASLSYSLSLPPSKGPGRDKKWYCVQSRFFCSFIQTQDAPGSALI